jgi:hypothetical protein
MKRTIIIKKKEVDRIKKKQMEISSEAVQKYPIQYQKLRSILKGVLANGLDVTEYYDTAMKICSQLKPLFELKAGSIFYFPYKNISPEVYGLAKTIMEEISDLLQRMNELDAWRKSHLKPMK